jgi:hypothetical protein
MHLCARGHIFVCLGACICVLEVMYLCARGHVFVFWGSCICVLGVMYLCVGGRVFVCLPHKYTSTHIHSLEGSCFTYVICDCLCIVVFNTYCVFVLFVFVLSTLCCQFLSIVHF